MVCLDYAINAGTWRLVTHVFQFGRTFGARCCLLPCPARAQERHKKKTLRINLYKKKSQESRVTKTTSVARPQRGRNKGRQQATRAKAEAWAQMGRRQEGPSREDERAVKTPETMVRSSGRRLCSRGITWHTRRPRPPSGALAQRHQLLLAHMHYEGLQLPEVLMPLTREEVAMWHQQGTAAPACDKHRAVAVYAHGQGWGHCPDRLQTQTQRTPQQA
jgi:hypothetical protein